MAEDIATRSKDSAATLGNADPGSSRLNNATTPPRISTTPVSAIRGPILTFLSPFIPCIIRAKAVITAAIAPAAEAKSLVSIKDSATMEPAIIPIATAIIIIEPFTF